MSETENYIRSLCYDNSDEIDEILRKTYVVVGDKVSEEIMCEVEDAGNEIDKIIIRAVRSKIVFSLDQYELIS